MGQFRIEYTENPRGNSKTLITNFTYAFLIAISNSHKDDFDKLINLLTNIQNKSDKN